MNYLLIFMLLLISSTASSSNADTNNMLIESLTQGNFKGLLRYSGQYRDSNLHIVQDSPTTNPINEQKQQYTALGGYLGYETASLYNFTVGATLYTSQPFGHNPDNRMGLGGLYEENGTPESYNVLGEAFINYQTKQHTFKVGRQEMPNYRFVSLSDVRMTPITHEGATYEYSISEPLTLNIAYITKMKERNADTFIDMAQGARLSEVTTTGKTLLRGNYDPSLYDATGYIGGDKAMSMLGLTYVEESYSLEAWNYYINDFLNTLYLFGQYQVLPASHSIPLTVSAQYAKQSNVGNDIAGNIDTWFYGFKLESEIENTSLFLGFNEVQYNENSYDGGTIFVRWGTPQMFNSFQVQDSEISGTQSIGAGVQYQFEPSSPLANVVVRFRVANYDMPNSLSKTDARQDKTETTFDLNYAFPATYKLQGIPLKGLSVQFRFAYNNYETSYDFDAYKAIHGYEFDSVTADFIDTRLYLNYQF